ncbi:XdhC family protein [Phycicoccus sp. MAQZ13P-2]|uniref:XdhC family protein n=1 Tax=Phycicoccus mangrovi TaxID=2840470 RepID=UPI001C003245|nr:XdhC family protein [Phycicoccus mangrovi]MBT9257316.1 XdhC family protein [Phycicoccus mangrovi]MBT9273395.1 XdhC family protein [Phycicoccus mangrovi]
MSDTRHDPVLGSGATPVKGALGHLVAVFDNRIAQSVVAIATATGWEATLLDAAPVGDGLGALGTVDALVVCNHDGDGAYPLLADALRAGVPYVAMMASRHRSAALLEQLRGEGLDDEQLGRLHVPAGLSIGGSSPGEIALSVVAEVVADGHGRPGTPMRAS